MFHWAIRNWSKNQHSWPIIRLFISSRHDANIDMKLCKNDSIISELESLTNIFDMNFCILMKLQKGIGFNYPIPENFGADDIHCWPWAKNILVCVWCGWGGGHKLGNLLWLLYSYRFSESSMLLYEIQGIFCFNENMQNAALWLTLAPPSPDTVRITLSTF